ncbi:MAG: S9 family peptidase [Acidobacteriota bacterium]
MTSRIRYLLALGLAVVLVTPVVAGPLRPMDVFDLEYASGPRLSPDGSQVVYVRNSMSVQQDRRHGRLWLVSRDGRRHRPVNPGVASESSPRWSPDGSRLLYLTDQGQGSQLHLRWLDSGLTAPISTLPSGPGDLTWSPDGRFIAFTMKTEAEKSKSWVTLPSKPKGANWATPPRVVDSVRYRSDGAGLVERTHRQVFVLPTEGGTPRQLTQGPHDHQGPLAWSPDGRSIYFSANLEPEADRHPVESEVHVVDLSDGRVRKLTERDGPDGSARPSPDGRWIAWRGYDDRKLGFHANQVSVMRADGSERRSLTATLDRTVRDFAWSPDSRALYVSYDDHGTGTIARVDLSGEREVVATGMGGTGLGRPYGGGSFHVGRSGGLVYVKTDPTHPGDLVLLPRRGEARRLTQLNDDILPHRKLGRVEELWASSSHDGRRIQGWVIYPPDYRPGKSYPLILEIHGGPFANYGDRFTAELQLMAAAGYVVLYTNPRGSTSYGSEFANLIHHAYPGDDYFDLLSCVDVLVERGVADPEQLYVTGGSGGGVLTAWIVGRTDRFQAAVVAKPVINWESFVLTADAYPYFASYWFPGPPWEHPEHYRARSPLSLVGNVTTPTMLLTGEKDYRTPITESEQYYQALQLRKVPTALVRFPDASHGIASKPSYLIAKVAYILGWFDKHDGSTK